MWIKTTSGLVDEHTHGEHGGSDQQVPHADEAGAPQVSISIVERTRRLVVELRAHIAKSKGNAKVAVLDWSELPWDEHIASPFLLQLKQNVVDEGSLKLPVVHINVPQGLLRLSKLAVLAYSGSEPLPTCVFFEGGTRYFWLGLALADPVSAAHTRETASGLDIRVLEQRMVTVFNDILHGVTARNTLRSIASQSDRALLLKHIRKTDLFTEKYIEDKSDRQHVPSGHFSPIVPLSALLGAIAETFNAKLRTALESDSCAFPPPETSGLVSMPNGFLVKRFYRCDGLLNYPPPSQFTDSESDPAIAQSRFRDALTAHLVDVARVLEKRTPGRFDLIVSCTSPTHWFAHQLADGLSDRRHHCGHFVGQKATTFHREFQDCRPINCAKVLVFTDVLSTGRLADQMIEAVTNAGFKVGGFIALVDTRTEIEIVAAQEDGGPLSDLDKDSQVYLIHDPIEKMTKGKAQWKIDPETLEPVGIGADHGWEVTLAGVGPLAMPGRVVANWLVGFAAIRHKHYNLGGHHSEFVCDVKRLLGCHDVRTSVGGRLNLYVRENDIDLVVYPNHSNAYLMASVLRDIRGSDTSLPETKVALNRNTHGERSYVLPLAGKDEKPRYVLLLDDGMVTGGTMRSLISALLAQYTSIREIHIVVFTNEMSFARTKYWMSIGTCEKFIARKARGRTRAFLTPRLTFSAFMSLPHPVYEQENCPLCQRQKTLEYNAEDSRKPAFEREFYRQWARDILPKDIYHDPSEVPVDESHGVVEGWRRNIQRSEDALNIARFDLRLRTQDRIHDLVHYACEVSLPPHVRVHCLRSLLHVRIERLDKNQGRTVWESLLEIIADPQVSPRHRLLAIKAGVWEQFGTPTLDRFCEFLSASAAHLWNPLVFGGVMAFARAPFLPGDRTPQWNTVEVSDRIRLIEEQSENPDVKSNLRHLCDWLTVAMAEGLGANALYLKQALLPRAGHHSVQNDVNTLSTYLREIRKYSNPEAALLQAIPSVSLRLVDHFRILDKAARIVLPFDLSNRSPRAWESLLNHTQMRLDVIRSLVSMDASNARHRSYNASAILEKLKSEWFASDTGYAHLLLCPFFHPLLPHIEEAIRDGETKYSGLYSECVIQHHRERFRSDEGRSIEVFCHANTLADALHNAVSNVWKYVIPKCSGQEHGVEMTWDYYFTEDGVEISIRDNGPGIPDDVEVYSGDGGHGRVKPVIESFGGGYTVQRLNPRGSEVRIKFHCKRRIGK